LSIANSAAAAHHRMTHAIIAVDQRHRCAIVDKLDFRRATDAAGAHKAAAGTPCVSLPRKSASIIKSATICASLSGSPAATKARAANAASSVGGMRPWSPGDSFVLVL